VLLLLLNCYFVSWAERLREEISRRIAVAMTAKRRKEDFMTRWFGLRSFKEGCSRDIHLEGYLISLIFIEITSPFLASSLNILYRSDFPTSMELATEEDTPS